MTVKKQKVALIGNTLANSGVEKIHALLSIFFENKGIEVHNILLWDLITYDYSGSINIIHTRREMKKVIRKNKFDFIIDFRLRSDFFLELLISRFLYPKNVVYTVHSGLIDYYFPKSSFLCKLIYGNQKIVGVSKAIKEALLQRKISKKVDYIYNPVNLESINVLKDDSIEEINTDYILAVGRLNGIKQFDQLIIAYSKSILPKEGVKLIIIGTGTEEENYKVLCSQLGLENLVEFKGFLKNPFPYYKNAYCTVLCSRNEGFPNVLIESLACRTPVISFDCYTGPSEIIINGHNGLLVEDQNFGKLMESMNHLFTDKESYFNCKENALASVEQFSLDKIGHEWLDYFKENNSQSFSRF
ncbi:glycosyltransferase [Flavobacterium collinsii]|uniref:N-acetylgalactosamine-N, N'-diacetylbacillosaminyl-diphospho-undecaprenol 4-alpha-N-acetylgalactosaminyltransferase n=1 Tax=Flavobacterium collinsii TaxID=1114861 RepID=A0ABN7EQU7_9FLAO|nr:glycosyltransferase [Flavobacterium collinsii]CAA9200804.1 N-acetylgalactosamine-N, N'-diacetylbacillosaminyl-diphospho-undecaprenol 4-alpha-N-acetylgalactosaminyltransferase [Flavobacterium collinsii]